MDWRNRRDDNGAIVMGWLLRLTLVFVLIGLVLYDAVAIAYGKVAAADDARIVARAATDAMVLKRASPKDAVKLAENRAESRGIELEPDSIAVSKDGSVTVVVNREINTLVTYRVGPIAHWAQADETYVSTPTM
ncbi:MAG: hypothetical protein CMH41_10200 [Micrococcales bacterium]|nr:hypothetical protein [Micrococcales bacterium]